MTECGICYLPIKNKIIFECSHEICLKCLIQILQMKTEATLSCPFCRRQINEEEAKTDSFITEIAVNLEENVYADIIQQEANEQSFYYDVKVKIDNSIRTFGFLVFTTEECHIIPDLISVLIVIMSMEIPANSSMETMIQSLRQRVINRDEFEIIPVEHHIQGFYDVIVKRIIRV